MIYGDIGGTRSQDLAVSEQNFQLMHEHINTELHIYFIC